MTKPKDFQIVEMLCPECDHTVSEFVTQLAIDPRMVCFKCQHVFKFDGRSALSENQPDSQFE